MLIDAGERHTLAQRRSHEKLDSFFRCGTLLRFKVELGDRKTNSRNGDELFDAAPGETQRAESADGWRGAKRVCLKYGPSSDRFK